MASRRKREPDPAEVPGLPVASADSEVAGADGGEDVVPADGPDSAAAAAAVSALGEDERLAAEVDSLKDQLLRALAETENLRKRAAREREEASKYGIANFARDVVGIADNLRRALESLPREAIDADERVKRLGEGVEMTERALEAVLARHGIEPINPIGQPFDHNFHQAMFEVDDSDQPPGTVVQVVQQGYKIRDRLLRPAMVGVAKKPSEAPRVDTEA